MLLKIMPALFALEEAGGIPLFTGGFVRDRELGIDSKDLDIEVYRLDIDKVIDVLSRFGDAHLVGKSFGVVKLRIGQDEFDFSLPRRDVKVAEGHRGFDVEFDPMMRLQDACVRRDFTFNAMLLDPFTGEVFDFSEGRIDLHDKVIRHVSDEHFGGDPLRALRAFQFAGRFDMELDPETALLISKMVDDGAMNELPVERVWAEWEKWASRSIRPSLGLRALKDSDVLRLYPEIGLLDGLPQDKDHHPEGDAFQHTLFAVDAARGIAVRDDLDDDMRIVLVMAALCHDFGKPETTEFQDDGRVTTYGHDKAGVKPTEAFLARIGAPSWVVDHVVPLVREHMVFRFKGTFKEKTYRRLALRIAPTTLRMLSRVMEADGSARPPRMREDPFPELLEAAERLKVIDEAPEPLLKGRHLIEMGMKPGPAIGALIKSSFERQLDGKFETVDDVKAWGATIVCIFDQLNEAVDEDGNVVVNPILVKV